MPPSIKSSSFYTNTRNVVNKEETLVQSRLQKDVLLLLLKTHVIASCSHMNSQFGDADAALQQKMDQLTNSGTFTPLMPILPKPRKPITNSRLSSLLSMRSLNKVKIRLPRKNWKSMLLTSMRMIRHISLM